MQLSDNLSVVQMLTRQAVATAIVLHVPFSAFTTCLSYEISLSIRVVLIDNLTLFTLFILFELSKKCNKCK